MRRTKKFIKRITGTVVGICCALILLLQIPQVNSYVTQGLLTLFVPHPYRIKIGKISGSFPFDLKVEKIILSDSSGKWLRLNNVSYSWRGIDLLFGKINFDYLYADKVEFLRLPISPDNKGEQLGGIPPHFPVINVDDFFIHTFIYQGKIESQIGGVLLTQNVDEHELEVIAYNPKSEEKLFSLHGSIIQDLVSLELTAEKDMEQIASIFPEIRGTITKGTLVAYLELSMNRQVTQISGFFTGLVHDLATTHPHLKATVGGKLEWNMDLNLAPHDSDQQLSAKVRSEAGMHMDCDLLYEQHRHNLSGAVEIALPQVQYYHLLGEKFTGNLLFQGDIENNQLVWQVRGLKFDGQALDASTGTISFPHLFPIQEVFFRALLKLPDFNPTIQGTYFANTKGWGIKDFQLTEEDTELIGELSYQPQLNAKMHLNIKDLSLLKHVHDLPLKGKVHGQIEIQNGKGTAQWNWHQEDLQWIVQTDVMIDSIQRHTKLNVHELKVLEQQTPLILLTNPWETTITPEKTEISKAHLKVGDGSLIIKPIVFSDQVSGEIQWVKLPLSLLRLVGGESWYQGVVEGHLKWEGSVSDPHIAGNLRLEKVHIPDVLRRTTKSFDAFLQVERQKQHFHLHLGYSDSHQSRVMLKGTLKSPYIVPTISDSLHLTVEGKYNVSILNGFLNSADRLKGIVLLSGVIEGSLQHPSLKGNFKLKDGAYENGSIGLLLQQVMVEGQLQNHTITLSTIRGKDIAKGVVSGQGEILVKNLASPQIHLTLKLNDLIVANSDFLLIRAGGVIKTYPTDQGGVMIGGDIVLHSADAYLADTAPKTKLIKIHERGEERPQLPLVSQPVGKEKSPSFGQLDLKVEVPNKLFIRGYGLNSEWQGNLKISGGATQPLMGGELKLIHGQMDVVGQTLNLAHGKITFDPEDVEPNPILDIAVVKQVKEIRAMIRLQGRASQPEISFTSIPVLPQEEVLSLILFGKSLNSVTADQSLRLAAAVASVKATGGQVSITDQIRNAFGLDDIGFQQEERDAESGGEELSSEYKLRVGKQLTEKAYIALKQGVSAEKGTDIALRYDLSENTKAEIEAGTGPRSNAAGLTWEKRY
jgi:hypothetical protein